MLLNFDVKMYTRSLRKSSVGKSARNKRVALKRSLCLNADSGLLGNVETHAIKMVINTPNTVATA